MPADGLAGRLTRVASVAAAALCLAAPSACRGAEMPADLSPAEAIGVVATVTGSIYRALDDAAVRVYVSRALASGTPIGDTEPCVTASNRPSRRPSSLANPPVAEASIRQRERAIGVLGAYASLVAALARSNGAPVAAELGDFERAAFAFETAAHVHAAGDLFVEDRAAALTALATRARFTTDRFETKALLTPGRSSIDALAALVRADVAKRRAEALATSHRAFTAAGATPLPLGAPLVACGEPGVAPADDASSDPALWPSPVAGRTAAATFGVDDIRRRAVALAQVDVDAILAALAGEEDAALVPAPEAAKLDDARGRVATAVQNALRVAEPLLFVPH